MCRTHEKKTRTWLIYNRGIPPSACTANIGVNNDVGLHVSFNCINLNNPAHNTPQQNIIQTLTNQTQSM